MGKNHPTKQRLYADQMTVTLESGHWVARFFSEGKLQWTIKSEKPATEVPVLVIKDPVRFSCNVRT